MNAGGRPPAVRRFLHRPGVWLALTVVAIPVLKILDETDREPARPSADVLMVEGRAGKASYGGIDVTYQNPLTDQRVEAVVGLGGDVPEPERGDPIDLVVDRDDPEDVRLAGDRSPESFDVVSMALMLGAALGWFLLRRRVVLGAEQLAGSDGPAFALLGTLEPPRRLGRRPCLHLWPLDAPAGSRPLCAVPVLCTGGLPVGGPAFPVEVKGSPRNLGRVVARAGDAVLWPSSRCLLSAWADRPDRVLSGEEAAAAATLPRASADTSRSAPPVAPDGPPARRFLAAHVTLALGLAASLGVVAIVAGITAAQAAKAAKLERDGVTVVAEVRRRNANTVSVTYRLPGERRVRDGSVPVDYPEDQKIGLRLPAYVDPDRPGYLRFARESYDAVEPIVWAALPAVALGFELSQRGRTWRRCRRVAARGPWHPVALTRRVTDHSEFLLLGPDSPATWPAAEVRVAGGDADKLQPWRADGTVLAEAAGDLDPGGIVAVRHDGRLLAVTSPARWPRTHTDRRRGFGPFHRNR